MRGLCLPSDSDTVVFDLSNKLHFVSDFDTVDYLVLHCFVCYSICCYSWVSRTMIAPGCGEKDALHIMRMNGTRTSSLIVSQCCEVTLDIQAVKQGNQACRETKDC